MQSHYPSNGLDKTADIQFQDVYCHTQKKDPGTGEGTGAANI